MSVAELPPLGNQAPMEWDLLGSHELYGESKHSVDMFREAFVGSLAMGPKVIDLSLLKLDEDSTKSVDQQLVKQVENKAADGNLCLSPDYAWLWHSGFSSIHVMRTFGAETSAHKVFFAVLHDPDDPRKGLPLAIKPCVTQPGKAYKDWTNNHLAREKDPRSYEPVGLIMANGVGYSMTRFKPEGFDTLASANWRNVLLYEDDPSTQDERDSLTTVANTLATLHKQNIFHGDPQFKNVVLDITGEVYLIDWESATFYNNEPEFEQLTHKITHDLTVLFSSMAMPERQAGVGLLSSFTYPMQWEHFKKYIFDPYMTEYMPSETAVDIEESKEFTVMAEVEAALHTYITTGQLYKSIRRNRHQTIAHA